MHFADPSSVGKPPLRERTQSFPAVSLFDELDRYGSTAFRHAIQRLRRYANDRRAAILIEGESGTGKTRIARLIHSASPRAAKPFEQIVISATEESLIGSALFGHVSGAFTDARHSRAGHFATASGGTVFLDEIGKASKTVQQKLLHVIETGEFRPIGSDRDSKVDVRVIAASNISLELLTGQSEFLPDLFARLRAFRVRLPSLRERRADIPELVRLMVESRARDMGYSSVPSIDGALMEALEGAMWPYNLRQLDATIHRIIVDAAGSSKLLLEHCADDMSFLSNDTSSSKVLTGESIANAIAAAGSMSAAARALGVDRTTLYRHKRRHASTTPSVPASVAQPNAVA